MKKLLIITLLFSHFPSHALDDGSDKIIKKYLKAIGGAKEWAEIKTLQIIRHQDNKHNDYLEKVSILRDKGIRQESMMSTGSPNVSGYYNGQGWSVLNPNTVKFKLGDSLNVSFQMKKDSSKTVINGGRHKREIYSSRGEQIKDIKDGQNQFFPSHFFKWQTQMPWNFLDYEAKGYKAIYKGDSKISVDEVSEIEMISITGDTARYFFDKRTALLLRAFHKNIQLDLSNYKQVNKVKIPYEVVETITDYKFPYAKDITLHATTFTIDQVKLNEPMDEKIFMKPKQ